MLLLYGKDGDEIDLEQQRTYCGNPACLSEPWCKYLGPLQILQHAACTAESDGAGVRQGLHHTQSATRAGEQHLPLSDLQTSILPTALPPILPTTSLISPTPFNPHSAPSTKKGKRVFSAIKSDREVEVARTASVACSTNPQGYKVLCRFMGVVA